jgi:hypothetical protein
MRRITGSSVRRYLLAAGAAIAAGCSTGDRGGDQAPVPKPEEFSPPAVSAPPRVPEAEGTAASPPAPSAPPPTTPPPAAPASTTPPAPPKPEAQKDPAQPVADAIAAIHRRLVEMKAAYPQLSEIQSASVTRESLIYAKGEVSWPNGKMGGPRFSKPSGCYVRVQLLHPRREPDEWPAMDQGAFYPEAKLLVSFFVFSELKEPSAFSEAVRRVVQEETDKLITALNAVR